MLAKFQLNTIEVLISKALTDSDISHGEIFSVNNVLEKYNNMKEKIKNLKSIDSDNIFDTVNNIIK